MSRSSDISLSTAERCISDRSSCLPCSSSRAMARLSVSIFSSGVIAADPRDWTSIDGSLGDGSAEIGAGYRMPKPTKEDREGHCLCRMVPRQLQQYDNRAHATSPLLQQSTSERAVPIRKIHLFEVWALARGAGVTSEWPYTRYNCYFRVSASRP